MFPFFTHPNNKYSDSCETILKNFLKTSVCLNQKTDFDLFRFVFDYTLDDDNFRAANFISAQNVSTLYNAVRSVLYRYTAVIDQKSAESLRFVLNIAKNDPVIAFRVLLTEFCKICVRNQLNSPAGKPSETLITIKRLFESAGQVRKLKARFVGGFVADLMRIIYSVAMEPSLGFVFGMQRSVKIRSFFESNREVYFKFLIFSLCLLNICYLN